MEWLKTNQVKVEPHNRNKRITGTRFASVLGLDRWNTPFKTWCAITKTYEEPFVDNVYTIAGKTIEPKIIEYLRKAYFMDIKTPTDIYGKDYFKKTWGNFFPDELIFGGMWDALSLDADGKLNAVIEIKTTKRVEDWQDGAPDNYALQAALYAYLLGIDDVIMVCGFLEEKDYEKPEDFIPSTENVIIDEFKISERFPMFQEHIMSAIDWWKTHVETGISPDFDEKKDEAILKELRKNIIEVDSDLHKLTKEADILKEKLDEVKEKMKNDEKRLKEITESLKKFCMNKFRDGDTKVSVSGKKYEWVLSKTFGTEIDKESLEADGLLDKYTMEKIGYRFAPTIIKEG